MSESANKDNVVLTLTGDFFCSKEFDSNERRSIEKYLSNVRNPVINFEGALESDSAVTKSIHLAADPDIISALSTCTVALSNNHVLDFEKMGLDFLLAKLNDNSIPFFGVNSNSHVSDNFRLFNFEGIKVCFMGFGAENEECVAPTRDSPGILNFDIKNLKSSFEALDKEIFDYLIVYAHIGYEFEKYPLPLHVGLCREAINLGADLVYCSHTHCLQPYEVHNEKYIFYGLGNFYFSSHRDRYPAESDIGAIVSISLSSRRRKINLLGVEKIQYERPGPGFKISKFEGYLKEWRLDFPSLKKYSQDYSSLRTRRRNPRPILYYNHPILNFIKYRVWKLIVDITGMLGMREMIKRLLNWQ